MVSGSGSPWSFSTWGSTPLACFRATCLPKHNLLQLVSSQFGNGECVFGCQSACAQTALPPGPAFEAASAYQKCILDGGPSMYIRCLRPQDIWFAVARSKTCL